MEIEKRRYFLNDVNIPICETINWKKAGINGIAINDSRCVSINGFPEGMWLPAVIFNPAFTIPKQSTTTEPVSYMASNGQILTYEKIIQVISSPRIDCYSLPLKLGWTEITKEAYNSAIISK